MIVTKLHIVERNLHEFSILPTDEQELFLWRSELRSLKGELITICNHHMQKYGPVFEKSQEKCCNICNTCNKKVKGDGIISLDMAKQLEIKWYRVMRGFKSIRISENIPGIIDEVEDIDVMMNFELQLRRTLQVRSFLENYWIPL